MVWTPLRRMMPTMSHCRVFHYDINPYVSTVNPNLAGMKVSSLINAGENRWNVSMLHSMFDMRDVNLILSIPLNQNERDVLFWRKDKLGCYSVKTAYVQIQEKKEVPVNGPSLRCWKRLWALKIPPKVKHFMWRAVSGVLPTKSQLRLKHVDISEVCPLCSQEEETISHAMLNCSYAKECWKLTDVHITDSVSFIDWFSHTFEEMDTNRRQQSAMLCWAIWKSRNDLVWNQRRTEVLEVVAYARVVLNQWKYAQDKTFDPTLSFLNGEDGDERWMLPQEDKIKVNCEAAIFEETNTYSYAFIGRDHTGAVVEARAKCRMGKVQPANAEAMGVKEALSWIKERNIHNAMVETDCLVVVQAMRGYVVPRSYFGKLINECSDLLRSLESRNVRVKFVKRSANLVAHFLARSTNSVADRTWRVTDEFINVLMNDINHE